MVGESRNKFFLAVAASLAAVKFVLLPWLDNQNDARVSLEVLTQRLDRSLGVIQNRVQIITAEQSLREATGKNLVRFPYFPALDAMKLDVQVRVGEMAKAQNLRTGLFEWILAGEAEGTGLQFGRARLQVSGELRKLAVFHGELESAFPNMVVRELKIESVPVDRFDEYGGTFTIVSDFYSKKAESP